MVKNPATGDVEAVTYSYDIDARKRDKFIMKKLLDVSFDYIGIIHPQNKAFEFRSRTETYGIGAVGKLLSYTYCCDYACSLVPDPAERQTLAELIRLDVIVADLRQHGQIRIHLPHQPRYSDAFKRHHRHA
jgi:hypothetical protein